MGPDSTGGQDDSDGPFLSIEEVQCGAGEAQEPQNAVSSVEHGSLKVDGAAERLTLIDYDNAPTPEPQAAEILVRRPTAAAAFARAATASYLESRARDEVPQIC